MARTTHRKNDRKHPPSTPKRLTTPKGRAGDKTPSPRSKRSRTNTAGRPLDHARLTRKRDKAIIHLPPSALIGRDESCDVQLFDPKSSADHARLRFFKGAWTIRDLGSRNKTTVNGHALEAGESMVVNRGDTLEFGSPKERFAFTSGGPAVPFARNIKDGTTVPMLSDVLMLPPNSRSPQKAILRRHDGRIEIEQPDGRRAAVDREVLTVRNSAWMLRIKTAAHTATRYSPLNVPTMVLCFSVGPALERVTIAVTGGGEKATLRSQAFSWMLLLLARAYDEDTGAKSAHRGWVTREALCRQLNMTPEYLTVLINRARKKFAAINVACAGELVERADGYLRIGVRSVQFDERAAQIDVGFRSSKRASKRQR